MPEQVSYEQCRHNKATPVKSNRTQLPGSPLLPGDDEDVIEEEEIHLLPRRPLEEDAVVLNEGRQLTSLYHPPGGRNQGERLEERKE